MFRHGDVSTETDSKPFFFTLAAFLGCLTAAVLVFVLGRGQGLAVFAGIMLSVVALAAGAVLLAMVTDQAYVRDGTLTMRYLFRKTSVPLGEIGKITYKEDVYSVFDRKGSLLGTINAKLTGIDTVLHQLDQNGVPFL
ncbi:MAG: hypothetical protein IK149_08675 [Oscillospiraceae bacterium]|nr:hypothetical protein [Oscillospiraceae bacterium]